MSVVAVSFMLQRQQYDALEKRAHALALKPSEYARQLYEAAFSARIADERGEETGDAALDRMVKQAFLLADCEPDFIAKVIGAPDTWVKAILDGWRAYAKGQGGGLKAARDGYPLAAGGGHGRGCQARQAAHLFRYRHHHHQADVGRGFWHTGHRRCARQAARRCENMDLQPSRRLPVAKG